MEGRERAVDDPARHRAVLPLPGAPLAPAVRRKHRGAATDRLLGSLQRANWTANIILAAVIVCAIPFCIVNAWRLTALRLGEDRAAALGVDVQRLRITTLIVASVLAAASVAFTGIIGFIGLVGPHVARMLVGEDQKFFLPAAAAAGSMLLSIAYAVSLSIIPGVAIPIGIITALVGVPFFVFLIFTRAQRKG